MAITKDDLIEKLRRRLPDAPKGAKTDDLLEDLIDDAQSYVCAYTNRNEMPDMLAGTCVKIAAMEYNRMGMEGESSHSEGSTSHSIDALPADIKAALTPYVLARTVR